MTDECKSFLQDESDSVVSTYVLKSKIITNNIQTVRYLLHLVSGRGLASQSTATELAAGRSIQYLQKCIMYPPLHR